MFKDQFQDMIDWCQEHGIEVERTRVGYDDYGTPLQELKFKTEGDAIAFKMNYYERTLNTKQVDKWDAYLVDKKDLKDFEPRTDVVSQKGSLSLADGVNALAPAILRQLDDEDDDL